MADEKPEPLSAAELQKLRASWQEHSRRLEDTEPDMLTLTTLAPFGANFPRLLATLDELQRDYAILRDEVASPEITRLEAERDAYREIVAAVAKGPTVDGECPWCLMSDYLGHDERVCPVPKARALLGQEPS